MSKITLLDGGLGQELVARHGAAATPLWSTSVMQDAPELVRNLHRDFFAAGATIATTNSYALHRDRLVAHGIEDRFADLLQASVTLAAEARDAHGAGRVAGASGPLGASYRPELAPAADEAAPLYAEVAAHLAPHVDLILLETMASVEQARGALMGVLPAGRPVWLGLSVDDEDGTRLRSGEALSQIAQVLEAHRPEAVLLNCSRPEAIAQGLPVIAELGLPFGAYANGFTKISEGFLKDRPTVDALTARHDLDPSAYAEHALRWVASGATIVGGCCEVGPAHIAEIARQLRDAGHEIV